ncbi:hypothetical protein O6H91_14G045200 [Diphasiastrum complanatum]|uniref:Uncharacterized protein n=8 Tax=Diphasiastrum complanatum TaxID=34168 RepID=A0ACC2BPX8_DIPCM|nr:hypothetical protein O6H91_14G040400 [Diphasiastrum complanatum]KAJ7531465.1 hypothetical protein O6H91_14G045200 [Diphasiastrum complanatum]KAJ7531466.1 hypothetical protein O6H91_14G045200 [Diphasiastrum complanatum]KAJ7531467.1 hypothetical protein O6H91_14G045200 [Diphasiastrum complanatum]KAJ7531468.1 hypothetical protein O6H91_14G045200 [Diphasiastrum complanatum]
MDDPLFSPSLKRPHSYYDREPTEANARQKCHQSSRGGSSTPRFFPDEVVFRILCPTSKTGSVIGKGGSIVKAIRYETGAKITVSDAMPGAEERVIIVSAQERHQDKSRGLEEENDANAKDNADSKERGEKQENSARMDKAPTSPAQQALFRVHSRIIEDERENESGADEDPVASSITTRLLVPSNQVGCLLGRGGKIIEQMREESGAQIRILPRDQLPVCALLTDELVQVFGEVNAVKKALHLISSRLQENPPRDRYQTHTSYPAGEALSKHHHSFHGQEGPTSPPGFGSGFGTGSGDRGHRSFARSSSALPAVSRESMPAEEELVFRILCSVDRIGSIIGRGGSIIQNLREETGAKIKVEELVPGADERVVVVSALEHLEDDLSPAQEAVFHVQDRIKDIGPNHDGVVTTRLLVPSNQVGCLLGKGGVIIAEMRRSSKASIRILGKEQLPKCALESDEVVQIVGDIHAARDALVQITSRLRANLHRDKALPAAALTPLSSSFGNDPFASGYGGIQEPHSPEDLPVSVSGLGFPNGRSSKFQNGISSPGSRTLQHDRGKDFASFEEGPSRKGGSGGLGRFTGGIIKSTTVEVIIPSAAVASVLGDNGNNMAQIQQISRAKVKLFDARPGAYERIVEISGTPDQTQSAQSLLEAFILSGQY